MYINSVTYLLVVAIVLSGCKTMKAPKGVVPNRKDMMVQAYGAWFYTTDLGPRQPQTEGELIAISADSVYVLDGDTLKTFVLKDIQRARVIAFNNQSSSYTLWTSLLAVGTLANGAFASFTLPLTLAVGIPTTIAEAKRQNFFEYPLHDWNQLGKFARFPQGLPQGLNTNDLKARE